MQNMADTKNLTRPVASIPRHLIDICPDILQRYRYGDWASIDVFTLVIRVIAQQPTFLYDNQDANHIVHNAHRIELQVGTSISKELAKIKEPAADDKKTARREDYNENKKQVDR